MTTHATNQPLTFEDLKYPQFVNDLPKSFQAKLVTRELAKTLNELDSMFVDLPGQTPEERAKNFKEDPRKWKLYNDAKDREERLRGVAKGFGPYYETKILKTAEKTYDSWLDSIKPPGLGDL